MPRHESIALEDPLLDEGSDSDGRAQEVHHDGPSGASKSQRRKQHRQRAALARNPAQQAGLTEAHWQFGQYPQDVQQAYFKEILHKQDPKLSAIEASEYPLHPDCLLNVEPAWAGVLERTSKSAAAQVTLAEFTAHTFKDTLEDLRLDARHPAIKLRGAPAILVITADAGRAATLCTELASILDSTPKPSKKPSTIGNPHAKADSSSKGGTKAKIAKLFGRHFKVSDQRTYLRTYASPIAVGTPARLRALLEPAEPTQRAKQDKAQAQSSSPPAKSTDSSSAPPTPALNLDHLEYVVLDISFRDTRQRNLLESDDARPEVLALLKEIFAIRRQRAEALPQDDRENGQGAGDAMDAGGESKKRKGEVLDVQPGTKRPKVSESAEKLDSGAEGRRRRARSLDRWLVMF